MPHCGFMLLFIYMFRRLSLSALLFAGKYSLSTPLFGNKYSLTQLLFCLKINITKRRKREIQKTQNRQLVAVLNHRSEGGMKKSGE